MSLQNENPLVYERQEATVEYDYDDSNTEEINAKEIFELIRNINDPEHPLTLEQLNVLQSELIEIKENSVTINFTPTIPHCSMATLIGLCIRVQLLRTLPSRYKVTIRVTKGTHQSEDQVNKQLNDKERVRAALENNHLLTVVNQCLKTAIY